MKIERKVNNMSTKKILIVVDMQTDFTTGALGSKEAASIVSNVAAKINEARANGDMVIFTQDTHGDDYMQTEEGKNLPVPHCIKGTDGWLFAAGLQGDNDNVFEKETFGSMKLGKFLETMQADDEEYAIELVGLCTDICVLSNAVIAKAAMPNAHVIVDAACCAGVTPESHDTALNAMKAIQVEVINQGKEPWRK